MIIMPDHVERYSKNSFNSMNEWYIEQNFLKVYLVSQNIKDTTNLKARYTILKANAKLYGESYNFFKKNFVAQETIDLNISWPNNFFGKYFMAPPINFSFLFKVYL